MPFKAPQIPYWVTVFAAINVVVGLGLGLTALLYPAYALDFVEGAENLGRAWGGRNAGFGLAMAIAMVLRTAGAYSVAFAGAAMRDVGDLINSITSTPFQMAPTAFLIMLITLIGVAFTISLKAARNSNT